MRTSVMAEVRTRIVSARPPSAPGLWPVPWAATRMPSSRAPRTISRTSRAVVGIATAAGSWSTATFQGMRAAS